MPVLSDRQIMLSDLETCMKLSAMLYLLEEGHDDAAVHKRKRKSYLLPLMSDSDNLDLFQICATAWQEVSTQRYVSERKYRMKPKYYLLDFMEDTAFEFRTITRVHKPTFEFILSKIHNHPIFHNQSNRPQLPVECQLYVALDRLGHDGNGTSCGRAMKYCALGLGTVHTYMSRVIEALLTIEGDWVVWPNAQHRRETAARMWDEFGFKTCVAFVDGTYLPLHRKPAEHGNTYLNRKGVYSVNAQLVVDDMKRVLHFVVGSPWSVHDSLAFRESLLVKRPELCFSPGEYILSDSAYAASEYLVPAYKQRQFDDRDDAGEPEKIASFNFWVARCRARNENAICMLKRRWRCLSGLRVEINENDDVERAKRMARACFILHNMCLEAGDPWEEENWLSDDEDDGDAEEQLVAQRGVSAGRRKRQAVRELHERWLSDQRLRGLQP